MTPSMSNSFRRLGSRFAVLAAGLAVTFFVGGCALFGGGGGGDAAPSTKSYTATMTGGEKLNSCGGDFGSALKVRIYVLESDAKFSLLGRSQLWSANAAAFEGQLLGEIQEIVLEPGKSTEVALEVPEGASFVAVAANFCETQGDCWRWIRPISELKSKFGLTFGETCIEPAP